MAKDAIVASAITDIYTGTIPAAGNNLWGHGKINAMGAMRALGVAVGVYTFSGAKLECALLPNPNNGSFYISYLAKANETLDITVLDISGKVISRENVIAASGENMFPISLENKASGIYMVNVNSAKGAVTIKMEVK